MLILHTIIVKVNAAIVNIIGARLSGAITAFQPCACQCACLCHFIPDHVATVKRVTLRVLRAKGHTASNRTEAHSRFASF